MNERLDYSMRDHRHEDPAAPPRRAKKSLGQHFLHDARVARRIVSTLDPRAGEPVIEIGPGRGALTARLVEAAGCIAVVELDRALAQWLQTRFDRNQLVLFQQDILQIELPVILLALGQPETARAVIAGNLPYHISKPVAQKMIRERQWVDRALLMFQREVAQRLTARPGGRDYGPLSVLAGEVYAIEILFDLPPGAFRPQPKVVSSVTRWRRRDTVPALDEVEEARLRACLALCFARRRQTLRNNLRAALRDDRLVDAALEAAELDGKQRAEAVLPAGFRRLAAVAGDALLQVYRDVRGR